MILRLARGNDYATWRRAADEAVNAGQSPENLLWETGAAQPDLFAAGESADRPAAAPARANAARVHAKFDALARRILCHRDARRHALLYRVLWRLQCDPHLLDRVGDADAGQLHAWDREVRRAAHKMKAFVRFKQSPNGVFSAWFDPGHPLLEAMSTFFVNRFSSMRWMIVTPDASCAWDGQQLRFGPGADRPEQAAQDPCEALWRTYYANIFNPARLKTAAMVREMPRRYWRDLPEAALIPALIGAANARMSAMVRYAAGAGVVAARAAACRSLSDIAAGISGCRECAAGCQSTRAVPGEGPMTARIMLVGEQPGDSEEQMGRPFVGPAGRVLDHALEAAQLPRDSVYLTNVVKHFGFRQRGTQRLHKSPSASIIEHCRWWLVRERELLQPRVVVALGKTAGSALQQPATFHPSYILRQNDPDLRGAAMQHLVVSLQSAKQML